MSVDFYPNVCVVKLDPEATIPTKTHLSDGGWDLYALEDTTIQGGQRRAIKTGIALQIPDEWVGLIWPRSGLAVKKGVSIMAGVIDSGYRDEVLVCLLNTSYNHENNTVEIKRGDRIAQILFHPLPYINMVEVDTLTNSDRGNGRFGSSGR